MSHEDTPDREVCLEQQLCQQREQLSLVGNQLAQLPNDPGLLELEVSLRELVSLLEAELLNLKKERLLADLSSYGVDSLEPTMVESEEVIDDQGEEATVDQLVSQFDGMECSVPFVFQNGQVEFHDAILQTTSTSDSTDQEDIVQCKAFFLFPVTRTMLTCPFYLQNRCRSTNSTDSSLNNSCQYSHGVTVGFDQIRARLSILDDTVMVARITQLTQSLSEVKLNCLVRNSALSSDCQLNLWSKAVVVSADFSGDKSIGQIQIRLVDNTASEHWVQLDQLVLLEEGVTQDDEDSADLSPALLDHQSKTSVDFCEDVPVTETNQFGEWERYTKGIGSKLLAKMGYQPGKGLGSQGNGIVDPIEPVCYPAGKSLDACFELKQQADRLNSDFKSILKAKARKLKLEAKLKNDYQRMDRMINQRATMFQFLNDRVLSTVPTSSQSRQASSEDNSSISAHQTTNQSRKLAIANSKLDSKSLNVNSCKVDSELRSARSELNKAQQSLRRNRDKLTDARVLTAMQDKVDRLRGQVDQLTRKQTAIDLEQRKRNHHKKLLCF